MNKHVVNSGPGITKPLGAYSRAVLTENTVYVAGQTGVDPDTGVLVKGSIDQETDQTMKNLLAVLRAAGLSSANVVKTNIYLTDIGDFAAVNKAYAAVFVEPFPARTTVQVAALPGGARVEIDMIAQR